jgi:hypothetical protein
VDEVDRPPFGHPQPARLGRPAHPGLQHPDADGGHGLAVRRAQGRVHEPEQPGVGQPEADMELPAGPQALHRVAVHAGGRFARQVAGEAVLDDGVEQAVLVAEEPVDRGRLHAGRERDRARGDRLRPFGGQQLRGDLDELRPGLVARRHGVLLPHVIDVNSAAVNSDVQAAGSRGVVSRARR